MVEPTVNVDHVAKQKKKKYLHNGMVYGSKGGVVEMHELGDYEIDNVKLREIITKQNEEISKLNARIEAAKNALIDLNTKYIDIDRRMKNYGLE